MVRLTVLFTMLVIFSACKKEEEPKDPCTNGFLDPGELQPDCGGNCPPCEPSTTPIFYLELNGNPVVMNNRELDYASGTWILQLSNDSITMQVSLGSDGSVQTSAIPPSGTFAYMHGIQYDEQHNGTYSITAHDQTNQLMSGFFQVQFVRSGMTDTLRFTNGTFENFLY